MLKKIFFAGIIYCLSRKESQDVTVDLQQRGIKTGCYHADLTGQERSRVHKLWLKDQIKVSKLAYSQNQGKQTVAQRPNQDTQIVAQRKNQDTQTVA